MDIKTEVRKNIIMTNKLPTHLMKLYGRELPNGTTEYYYIDRKWYYHKLVIVSSTIKENGVNRHYIMDIKCNNAVGFAEMSGEIYYGIERIATLSNCIQYLRMNYGKTVKKETI